MLRLVLLALVLFLIGYGVRQAWKRRKRPPDLLVAARLPVRCPRFFPIPGESLPSSPSDVPRVPPVTLETYQRLIQRAIENRVRASIPIPAFYLEPLLAYFAADEADGRLSLDVEALCDDERAAHLCVRPVAGTTGEHRAIR